MTKNEGIKAYCLDCCNGERTEVKECPSTGCPLYPFRLGTEIMENRDNPDRINRRTAIQRRCRECSGGLPCKTKTKCPLHICINAGE